MKRSIPLTKFDRGASAPGFTLIELIVATAILSILTMMALPLARVTIQREKERELRAALWEMRDAIDRYKDAADRQMFQTKVDSQNYPPDLETLVKGVEAQGGKKIRFLRSSPEYPMTKSKEWGLRSMQDDPDSDSWGGQNVFDVYSKSEGTGLDGTKYKDWKMKRSANQFARGDKRYFYRGFTLLELMIVISIMMILMAVAVPLYQQ